MTAKQARRRVILSEADQITVRYIETYIATACNEGDYTCDTKIALPANLNRHFTSLGYTIAFFDRPQGKGTHQLFWCNSRHSQ